MNYRKIGLSLLAFTLTAVVLIALPGCKDKKNDKTEQILAETIVGKWNFEGGYEKQNGEWVRISDADDEAWYDFKPDGTVDAYRRSGEVERSMLMKWSVDKETGDLRIFKESGESVPIKAVFESDDRFYFYYTTGVEPSTGETREGEFKEVLVRETPKSIAEKIVGKWNSEGYYEKLNGEWVRLSNEVVDGNWYDFKPDGTLDACRRNGESEQTHRMKWSVDEATGDVHLSSESGTPGQVRGVFENADRFAFHYTTNIDPDTGPPREGEFKEVLVREKK